MIDVDKVKAAFASTAAFCQQSFYQKDGNSPAAMCALSSLVSAAGVHPDLIGKFNKNHNALTNFFGPVLEVEYGIPSRLMRSIAQAFDDEPNEFKGINKVLVLFENENKAEEARKTAAPVMWGGDFSEFTWPGMKMSYVIFDWSPPADLNYDKIVKFVEGDVLNSLGYKVQKGEKKLITGLVAPQIIETVPADADFETYAAKESAQLVGSVAEWKSPIIG